MHSDLEGAVDIGNPETISVYELVATFANVAGKRIFTRQGAGPVGVHSLNFSNAHSYTFAWQARFPLRAGIERTDPWIETLVKAQMPA